MELDINKDYPFRPSLTNKEKAKCGFCKFAKYDNEDYGYDCEKRHQIVYPTEVKDHSCEDYEYRPDEKIIKIPNDKIKIFTGIVNILPECFICGNNLQNYCDGISWFPFDDSPKCEFFINKDIICKHAIPYFQYGNHIRNNYCKLDPEKRDGNMRNSSWECNCPSAHKGPIYYKCYTPLKEAK